MTATRPKITGSWRKALSDSADTNFPDCVEFFGDGTYRAGYHSARRGAWDEASYDLLEDGRLRIETANDRKVSYDFELRAQQLVISIGNEKVLYQRSQGEGE